jgi:hypothetical protein
MTLYKFEGEIHDGVIHIPALYKDELYGHYDIIVVDKNAEHHFPDYNELKSKPKSCSSDDEISDEEMYYIETYEEDVYPWDKKSEDNFYDIIGFQPEEFRISSKFPWSENKSINLTITCKLSLD